MIRRLLITRPQCETARLAAQLADLGYACLIEPLLTIRPLPAPPLELAGVQALLVTSRNGVRALAAATDRRDLPLAAVGPSTAELAREAGFHHIVTALADTVSRHFSVDAGVLLHASGAAAAGDLVGALTSRGYQCRRVALYEAVAATALSAATRHALAAGGLQGALFFSPRTAATFVRVVEVAGQAAACRTLEAFCLSPAVAETAAGLPWRRLVVAEQPSQAALLRLLQDKEFEA